MKKNGFMFAAFAVIVVFALAGCGDAQDTNTDESEGGVISFVTATSFSKRVEGDSVIKRIRDAKKEGVPTLRLRLQSNDTEVVEFGKEDLLAAGLVLNLTNSPATIVIDGNGRVVDLTGSPNDKHLITVSYGVTLTLTNITFKGLINESGEDANNNTVALIGVKYGGKLILDEGAKITKNKNPNVIDNSDFLGGGVVVHEGGNLIMNAGAEISDNFADYGGGVFVGPGGMFTMKAGDIKDNKGVQGGGVMVDGDCSFIMNGGSISNNKATGGSDDRDPLGGGVLILVGTFEMHNGFIQDNTAKNESTTGMGGGVLLTNNGTFTMTNGSILRNDADNGGGVFMGAAGRTFEMKKGTIDLNDAKNGGGVYVEINKNNLSDTIAVTFRKTGGVITAGNAAKNGNVAYIGASETGTVKFRDTEVNDGIKLYVGPAEGGFTFNDTKTGGAGNTESEWKSPEEQP
jgi:hypothetical protein